MQSQLVKGRHATIEVYSGGSGETIVMLPSLGRGASDFFEIAEKLMARGYRVLLPEPRGIERSTGEMEHLTLHDLAGDVADVIEAEGGGPAVICGHAFGQKVGRALASRRGDLVRTVIMLAGAGRAKIPEDVRRSILASGDLSLPDSERLEHLRVAFFAPGNDPSAWLSGWHPEAKRAQMAADQATPDDEFIPAGTAPILDVQAELDTVVPLSARGDLKNELGERVTVVTVEGAGHALLPERPDAAVEAIHSYLGRV